jgi:transposase
MIQIIPQMRIFLCVEPVDFRKGIDGLCRISRRVFGVDPFDGALFVFCNRRRTALRLLVYDGQGFWLVHKRLSTGRFHRWPERPHLDAHELHALIWNFKVPPQEVQFFKKLPK